MQNGVSLAGATAAVAVTAATMNPSPLASQAVANNDGSTPTESAGTDWQTKVGGSATREGNFAEKALASKTGNQIT